MSFPRIVASLAAPLVVATFSFGSEGTDRASSVDTRTRPTAAVTDRTSHAADALSNVASTTASKGDWPQWRGVGRDGLSSETDLLEQWPRGGPMLRWTYREAGIGFSGPAVVDGTLYGLGADDAGTFAFALDLATGKRTWRTPLADSFENTWGDGPRSTPTVDGDRLYVLTATGALACLDQRGKIVWRKSLANDFGGGRPGWGYCESPLVDGAKVVVTPGRSNCMVALDKRTGETIWSSEGLDDPAQYASIVKASVGAVSMYVTMTRRGLIGIDAETGRLLWRFEKIANPTAVIPTPIFHDGYVYGTSGYGAGCGLVKLVVSGSQVRAEEVYSNKTMKNQHGGVLLLQDHLYGYSDGVGWVCQDFKTGKLVWRERSALGKGSIAYADGRLYCYAERDGAVALVDAAPSGWVERGRFTIPETTGNDRKNGQVWTHPVVADGNLILRDQELLFCYDIRKR